MSRARSTPSPMLYPDSAGQSSRSRSLQIGAPQPFDGVPRRNALILSDLDGFRCLFRSLDDDDIDRARHRLHRYGRRTRTECRGNLLASRERTLAISKNDALQLLAFYSGPVPPLRFSDLTGLIGFPSFHTVMAFLTAQAVLGNSFCRNARTCLQRSRLAFHSSRSRTSFHRCCRRICRGTRVYCPCRFSPAATRIR